jgi:predicted secreted hydrolase
VRLPELGLELDIRPTVPDQELDTRGTTGVIYWEGSVAVSGTRRGRPLRGVGYVELTGYDGQVPMKNPPGVTPR